MDNNQLRLKTMNIKMALELGRFVISSFLRQKYNIETQKIVLKVLNGI